MEEFIVVIVLLINIAYYYHDLLKWLQSSWCINVLTIDAFQIDSTTQNFEMVTLAMLSITLRLRLLIRF